MPNSVAVPHKTLPETLQDLWELLGAYATQETVDPLRTLGRYLGVGRRWPLLMALGTFFLGMTLLRFLQTRSAGRSTGLVLRPLPHHRGLLRLSSPSP